MACGFRGDRGRLDEDFDIPRSEAFPELLSAYELYDGPMAELVPAADAVEYDLASPLFTDYSYKQRLLKLPPGESMAIVDDRSSDFPEGTVVAKTFYYPVDFGDDSLGWEVIETRLLVMREGEWNVATYVWNEDQTDARLLLEGEVTSATWTTESGSDRATDYEIPSEVACVTCHQHEDEVDVIGLRPRNLNIEVMRDGAMVNQLEYLQSRSILTGDIDSVATIAAYEDDANDLETRARAYLDANCAHCHSPGAWERAVRQDFDFRFETSLQDTGILGERRDLEEALLDGEMPYIGTTVPHDEGIDLVLDYLDTL